MNKKLKNLIINETNTNIDKLKLDMNYISDILNLENEKLEGLDIKLLINKIDDLDNILIENLFITKKRRKQIKKTIKFYEYIKKIDKKYEIFYEHTIHNFEESENFTSIYLKNTKKELLNEIKKIKTILNKIIKKNKLIKNNDLILNDYFQIYTFYTLLIVLKTELIIKYLRTEDNSLKIITTIMFCKKDLIIIKTSILNIFQYFNQKK